ncbi:hypothetical protein [Microterricola viridarii]|nr:hypothetical protein [Microterricola viridarii]
MIVLLGVLALLGVWAVVAAVVTVARDGYRAAPDRHSAPRAVR